MCRAKDPLNRDKLANKVKNYLPEKSWQTT